MSSTKIGPNRRSVLKGAAWTAPAIVVATAAPAMAASGPTVSTTITSLQSGSNLDVTLTFNNAGTVSTSNPTTLAVRFTPTLGGIDATAPTNIVTAGASWSFVSTTTSGTSVIFNFVSTGIPGGTSTLKFRVKVNGSTSTGNIASTGGTSTGVILPGAAAYA